MFAVWPFLPCILCITSVFAADFSGQVVSVLDGDTLEVLHNHHPERIRLSGSKTALRHLTIGLSLFKQASLGKF